MGCAAPSDCRTDGFRFPFIAVEPNGRHPIVSVYDLDDDSMQRGLTDRANGAARLRRMPANQHLAGYVRKRTTILPYYALVDNEEEWIMAANLPNCARRLPPARQAGGSNVQAFFEANRGTLAALLPSQMPVERMLKLALGAPHDTEAMDCTTESLFRRRRRALSPGLEPNTPLGHAYLILFEKRAKRGSEWVTERTDVQVVIGYKGMLDLDLPASSGQIISISAREVRENDHFEPHYGTEERLEHRPVLRGRGDVIGFYAVAKLVGGGCAFEFMSREDVDAIRDARRDTAAEASSAKHRGRTLTCRGTTTTSRWAARRSCVGCWVPADQHRGRERGRDRRPRRHGPGCSGRYRR